MYKNVTVLSALLLLIGTAGAAGQHSSIDWIAGHWCSEAGENIFEEIWLPPHGGVTVGVGRSLKGDKTTGFEFFRIADIDGVQSFVAQPSGNPPTVFSRTDGGETWVIFENAEHDFPQRIGYRRVGDSLHAEVAGPGKDGTETVIRLDYVPCES